MMKMEIYRKLSRLGLWVCIVFLSLSALFAIACVLLGDFGEFEGKVLGSCVTVALASIGVMSCAAAAHKPAHRIAAPIGMALAILSGAMIVVAIWGDIWEEEYFKSSMTAVTFAVAFSHALLLNLVSLKAAHRWVQAFAVGAIFLLATLIVLLMWLDWEDVSILRLLATLSIVVALLTVIIPILIRFNTEPSRGGRQMTLTAISDRLYRNAEGDVFEVNLIQHSEDRVPDQTPDECEPAGCSADRIP